MKFVKLLIVINRLFLFISLILIGYFAYCVIALVEILFWCTIIEIVLFICMLIIFAFTGPYIGVPNNNVNSKNIIIKKELILTETKSNVWEVKDNPHIYFDMQGWLRQKFYISNFLSAQIALNSYNKNKQTAYSLPFGRQKIKCNEMKLVFVSLKGKTTNLKIVHNNNVKKTFSLRLRFLCSLSGAKGQPKNIRNYKYYKIEMEDCFKIIP